jgi:hypothetical protein
MCDLKAQLWGVVTQVTALNNRILNSLTSARTRPADFTLLTRLQ